jgi:ribosomal protein S18 acetylase RimI-like enzyme
MDGLAKLKGLIEDLGARTRQAGWTGIVPWLFQALVSLPYCHTEYTVFVRSLREPLPAVEPRLAVTLRPAAEADLERFRDLVPPSELGYFRRRLAHGRHCFLALDGEHLAAYCWATNRVERDIDNLELHLQPGDVYGDDAYTAPAYRRQGIQSALLVYRLDYVRSLGYQRLVAIVAEDNEPSQRMVRKLGYQEAGHLSFRRILWHRAYHCRGEPS